MTCNELVDPYMKHLGMKRDVDSVSVEIIFPHIVMDTQNMIFHDNIEKKKFRHRLAKIQRKWKCSYIEFNTEFFLAYRNLPKHEDKIIELMDSFNGFIQPHTFIAQIALMNALMDAGLGVNEQELLASCYLCNAFAKAAASLYGETYRTEHLQKRLNSNIESVIWCSREMRKELEGKKITVSAKRSEAIEKAIQILIRKIVEWLFNVAPKVMEA